MSYFILYRDRDGETHKRQPVGKRNTLADAERMAQRLANAGCTDVELYEEHVVETLIRSFGGVDARR